MEKSAIPTPPHHTQSKPRPAKRAAILSAARSVFAQRGFDHAGMESIAAAAAVSNKTIYNHFGDKATLFAAVMEESAGTVAAAQIATIDRHLVPPPADPEALEAALIAFALEWHTPMPEHREHRALVAQIRAEVGRVPATVIDAWQQAGPARVRTALAAAFAAMSDTGLLSATDSDVTAAHFTRLVAIDDPLRPGARPSRHEVRTIIADAVHAFLHGHLRNTDPTPPKRRSRRPERSIAP